jgi:SAM-dependent MidA family methyltransferase
MKMPTDAIRDEIQKCGVISFARFMDLALYCPETGYYEQNRDNVGRRGDFITSVSTGSLFGELLAFQFAEWLEAEVKSQKPEARIIEAGAHDGRLAGDILNWLKKFRPELFAEVEYCILEPSPARRQWQQERLKDFPNVRWPDYQLSTANHQLTGILFSNELLDAFPVRRFGWEAKEKKWFEWGVALDGEKFVWMRLPERPLPAGELESQTTAPAGRMPALQLPSAIRHLPTSLLDILPDGYIVEDSPAAAHWWREAAQSLKRGKLLAIDYGYTAEEQISPTRLKGTLRAYHRHQVSDDLLAQPGEQDLTAHVNFSAIQTTGEEAGLKTDTFCTQPQFLTRILSRAMKEKPFASLDPKQIRQFQTLTHPEHLGRAFRVLVQSR